MLRRTLLGLMALAFAALPQRQLPVAEIEKAVSAEMTRAGVPGLSVAVVVDHEVRYANGFGLADLENFVPARAVTAYRTASIAKTMTATAVLQLFEQGKIDLEAPVQKYVPGFPQKEWAFTIRHLLCHQSGIRHYRDEAEVDSTRHYTDLVAPLDLFKHDALLFRPGARYSYSTYGYNLLGAVVEAASGEKFVDYLRRHIFEPAGMEAARNDDPLAVIPNRARGYTRRGGAELHNAHLADTSNKIPGGGLSATVVDLARFAIALQQGKLLKPDTLERAWTPQATLDGKSTGYGLGWGLRTLDELKLVEHGGGQQGLTSRLQMVPDRGFAITWMCNLEGANLSLADQLTRLLIGQREQ